MNRPFEINNFLELDTLLMSGDFVNLRKIKNKECYLRKVAKKDKRFNADLSDLADDLRKFRRVIA